MTAPHRHEVRIYYEDVDLGGVVYYANYLRYLERGRTELLRRLGVDQAALKRDAGVVFVVARLEIDYRRPARFDDLVVVETEALEIKAASATLAQRIVRDPETRPPETLVDAVVRLAAVDETGRPRRLPAALRDGLSGAVRQSA